MARPDELVSAVLRALDNSSRLPDDLSYLDEEPDTTGSDANVKLPVCSIQTIGGIRLDPFNTDQVDVLTDKDGNAVGRIYHSEYRLDLQLDVWVAEGSSHDADTLGNKVRSVLYNYDSAGPSGFLKDNQGQNITDVWRFRVGDGERRDDLTMTPSLRRWRQELALWSYEEFSTTEDYIAAVDYPQEGDFVGNGQQITDAP